MSDQTTREAAARAWFKNPTRETFVALWALVQAGREFEMPNGPSVLDWTQACADWLAWAKADAAMTPDAPAREADALEGVVWRSPWAVYVFHAIVGGGPVMHPDDTDVLDGVAKGVAADVIAAHARAQLDAAATECSDAGYYAHAQLAREAHKAAPVQPAALTLDEIREAAKARGYQVVHESGYEAPGAVLAYIEHALSLSDADGDRYLECFDEIEDGDKPAERAAMAVERDRLRALGVTPAVLS